MIGSVGQLTAGRPAPGGWSLALMLMAAAGTALVVRLGVQAEARRYRRTYAAPARQRRHHHRRDRISP